METLLGPYIFHNLARSNNQIDASDLYYSRFLNTLNNHLDGLTNYAEENNGYIGGAAKGQSHWETRAIKENIALEEARETEKEQVENRKKESINNLKFLDLKNNEGYATLLLTPEGYNKLKTNSLNYSKMYFNFNPTAGSSYMPKFSSNPKNKGSFNSHVHQLIWNYNNGNGTDQPVKLMDYTRGFSRRELAQVVQGWLIFKGKTVIPDIATLQVEVDVQSNDMAASYINDEDGVSRPVYSISRDFLEKLLQLSR